MKWRRDKTPQVPLIDGDTLNLKVLTPRLAAALKACLGKLDKVDFDPKEVEQVQAMYNALGDISCTIVAKGLFGEYGAPVEYLKATMPNPKRN